ncbi:MAG: DUF6351 family protein [Gemmatimonadota bacterium]
MHFADSPIRNPIVLAMFAAATWGLAACGGGGSGETTLRTVPTPADYVSGGETLVLLEAPGGADLEDFEITLNGGDVRSAFRPAPSDRLGRESHAFLGLVEGLAEGTNTITATRRGVEVASLSITNYPIEGPIFSGEHLQPYLCLNDLSPGGNGEPRRFSLGNDETLGGPAQDASCSYPTRVDYLYRAAGENGSPSPLASPASLPANVDLVVTSLGDTVPFMVRLETGTINRAIYQFAALVDPANPEPDPWNPPVGWNGRLIYTFGGGCEAGFFQGTATGGVLRADLLASGYAVASSTLNVNSQGGCNDPLSAETTMMVKERFAETFGPPLYTIGNGGSGGAMQQLLIAGAYPGILDGILPTLTFPDAITNFIDATECSHLLRPYLNETALDEETKRVIGGWAVWATCDRSLAARPNRVAPYDCPAVIPESQAYDPATNPTGIRCSIYDGMRNVFGTRMYPEIEPTPVSEFARSPHDNVGVQYGLMALNAGRISNEVFLDLNERVGGWDIDGRWRPERTTADPDALRIAYETGRVTSGTGGLAITPVIEERAYRDFTGDFHTSYYSFVTRARLIRDNGHADNYIMIRRGGTPSPSSLEMMDAWLKNLALDESADPQITRIMRAKPPELLESCWDEEGVQMVEPQTFDEGSLFNNTAGRCNALFPPHTGPRMVAGGPLANDILKCQLKPLDRADYGALFTDEEWARLGRIFLEGVCDWSKPGVGQVPQVGTWLSYGPSPVNRY